MGALGGRKRRHRAGLAGAALLALLVAAPSQATAAREHVRWTAGGGIAGGFSALTIDKDHTARAETNEAEREFRLGDGRWATLERRLRAARFATLEREYAPKQPVPDGTSETVRYRGRSVSVETGGHPPRRLRRLLGLLARIHSAHEPPR